VWGRVEQLVDELLANPLRKPSVHLMTGHQLVYRIAGGSCTEYPADVLDIVAKYRAEEQAAAPSSKTLSAAGPQSGQSRPPHSMLLRDLLGDRIRRHVVRIRTESLAALNGHALLVAYVEAWRRFGFSILAIGSVFSYAHTAWYPARHRGDGTRVLGECIWREALYDGVKTPLIRACLDAISQDRAGEVVERHVVRAVAESFTRLSGQPAQPLLLYQSHLESNYLRKLEDFLGRALLRCRDEARGDTSAELSGTVRLLQAEVDRAEKMLHPSTSRPLMKLITSVIPAADIHRIFGEVGRWADADAEPELRDLYWLARHTDGGCDTLADAYARAIEAGGRAAIDASQGPVWFAHAANAAVTKAEGVIKRYFDGNRRVHAKARDAFAAVVNDNAHMHANPHAAAELLAMFAHIALRPGSGQAQADLLSAFHDTDTAAEVVVVLLRFLSDRDVFQALYAKHLATRILTGVFTPGDEHAMIAGIAGVVTQHDFCYKWRRMLTDVERSAETRAQMIERGEGPANSSVDFRPLVATQGTWPLLVDAGSSTPMLPPAVDEAANAFARFYLKSGGERRRLVWLHGQASAVLRPTFTKRRHDITVSFQQACLLLAPQYAMPQDAPGPLTPANVGRWCGVAPETLVRPLAVLERLKLVKFVVQGAAAPGDNTEYVINDAFTAPAQKINAQAARDTAPPGAAATVAAGKAAKDHADAAQRVVDDRKFAVQAAIVRVCKSRKSVKFQVLVAEVIKVLQQSTFTPTVQLVKVNIENLIDKEYLERNPDDHDTIDYVA